MPGVYFFSTLLRFICYSCAHVAKRLALTRNLVIGTVLSVLIIILNLEMPRNIHYNEEYLKEYQSISKR